MHCYVKQTCCVRWDNVDSKSFKVTNGVRQGSSTSPYLFSVYIDALFLQLEASGLGCYVDDQFLGVFGYADDVVLLSPSLEGLQKMLDICNKFCVEHGIQISVDRNPKKSKTKTVAFNCKNKSPSNLILNDIPVPWSDSYKHLGHKISSDQDMFHDLNAKCGEFNGKVHALRQEIGSQHPDTFMKLTNIYLSTFYGSSLWDLSHANSNKLWTTWNTLIRTTYNLNFRTHCYITTSIYKGNHLKTKLLTRFINFYKLIAKSDKSTIKTLMSKQRDDLRSSFGRNCRFIQNMCNVPNIKDACVKNIPIYPVPEGEQWRLNIIQELLNTDLMIPGVDNTNRKVMLDELCTN